VRDSLGSVQSVLVLGATSEIAGATAKALVARRARRVLLAARDPERCAPLADELRRLGATDVDTIPFDARDTGSHHAFAAEAFAKLGDVDLALVGFGVLEGEIVDVLETNLVGAASVMAPIARLMQQQGHGTIVVLSSVAGERARKSNYLYGASKAGLDAYAQGLGDSLAGSGVDVMVVRPGFVRTKMTAGRKPPPGSTTPDAVADAIVRGLARRSQTVWVPPALRAVMAVLRHLPRGLFRRLPI
jgi:decaprenylphospho-beta-D-erythro-pentofuranosid-2-ulose 2-reductase